MDLGRSHLDVCGVTTLDDVEAAIGQVNLEDRLVHHQTIVVQNRKAGGACQLCFCVVAVLVMACLLRAAVGGVHAQLGL